MEEPKPVEFKNRFSTKFYIGIGLILLSLLMGKIPFILLFFFSSTLENPIVLTLTIVIYIISWPILIWGVWWVGKEYAYKIKRYFDYKYYHQSLKRGTAKAFQLTKEHTDNFRRKTFGAFKKKK